MKRTVIALALALAISAPATAALAGPGGGPRYDCNRMGSYYYGATPGTAKHLERNGYTCVRAN